MLYTIISKMKSDDSFNEVNEDNNDSNLVFGGKGWLFCGCLFFGGYIYIFNLFIYIYVFLYLIY